MVFTVFLIFCISWRFDILGLILQRLISSKNLPEVDLAYANPVHSRAKYQTTLVPPKPVGNSRHPFPRVLALLSFQRNFSQGLLPPCPLAPPPDDSGDSVWSYTMHPASCFQQCVSITTSLYITLVSGSMYLSIVDWNKNLRPSLKGTSKAFWEMMVSAQVHHHPHHHCSRVVSFLWSR